jgi:hypothetical protein
MFGSFLPGLWLVGTTKVYPGIGADFVMESIAMSAKILASDPELNLWTREQMGALIVLIPLPSLTAERKPKC